MMGPRTPSSARRTPNRTPKAGSSSARRTPAKQPPPEPDVHVQYAESVLRLHLPASHRANLKIRQARKLENPQLQREFERVSEGLTTLDAWFYGWATDDADAICRQGFRAMGGQPMRFGLYMSMPDLPATEGPRMKMILCKVAVGKSIIRDSAVTLPGAGAESDRLPAGYQSIYMAGDPESHGAVETTFRDTYTLFDPSLAIPTHAIEFQMSATASRGGKDYAVCEKCGNGRAVVYSLQTNTKLCAACDAQAHASPYTSRFSRLTLDSTHDADDYRFDCMSARVMLEEEANRVENQGHMFITLDDAFSQMKATILELESEVDNLPRAATAGLDNTAATFETETFERSNLSRHELLRYLKDYQITLQVAEERRCEMRRTLQDLLATTDFMQVKKTTMTKVAMLNVWKNLECQRADLQHRLAKLALVPGNVIEQLTLSQQDREIEELDRQIEQKDRVMQLLKNRLRNSGTNLTETDLELLAM